MAEVCAPAAMLCSLCVSMDPSPHMLSLDLRLIFFPVFFLGLFLFGRLLLARFTLILLFAVRPVRRLPIVLVKKKCGAEHSTCVASETSCAARRRLSVQRL